jgi:hypothetical protein
LLAHHGGNVGHEAKRKHRKRNNYFVPV